MTARALCRAGLCALLCLLPAFGPCLDAGAADALMWTEDGYRVLALNGAGEALLLSEAMETRDGFAQHVGVRFLILPPENSGESLRTAVLTGGDGTEKLMRAVAAGDGWLAVGSTSSTNLTAQWHEGWYDHGEAKTDGWAVRVDRDGAVLWQRSYGGSGWDSFAAVCDAHDSGWIVVGSTDSRDGDVDGWHDSGALFDQSDGWVAHIDPDGALRWQTVLGGGGQDTLTGVAAVPGGYLIVGSTNSANGDAEGGYGEQDGWVVLLDPEGQVLSERHYGGASEDGFSDLAAGPDGWLAAGATWSGEDGLAVSSNRAWAVLLDGQGEALWTLRFGSERTKYVHAVAWQNGSWLVAGITYQQDGGTEWIAAIQPDGGAWQLLRGEM